MKDTNKLLFVVGMWLYKHENSVQKTGILVCHLTSSFKFAFPISFCAVAVFRYSWT